MRRIAVWLLLLAGIGVIGLLLASDQNTRAEALIAGDSGTERRLPGKEKPREKLHIVVGEATGGFLNADLFGVNLQWTDRGDGLMPGTRFDQESAIVTAIKDRLQPPLVRFPGGLMASLYQWEDGLAAGANRRGRGRNFLRQEEDMVFGSAEYLALLSTLCAEGMITINLNAPAASSAKWLEWLAEHARSQSGGCRPELPWWEVGNESYLKGEPSEATPEKYIAKFLELHKAMREAADRQGVEVRLGALLEANLVDVPWFKFVVTDVEWNRKIIDALAGKADFFVVHQYGPFDKGDLPETKARQLILASPERLGHNLREVDGQLRAKGSTAPILVTEFNFMVADHQKSWYYGEDAVQGAYIASVLIEYARSGIRAACFWSLIGNHNFGLINNAQEQKFRPAGQLFENLIPLRDSAILDTWYAYTQTPPKDGAVFSVEGVEPLRYEHAGVMDLDPKHPWFKENPTIRPVTALAMEKDGRRFLLVVNRSATQAATIRRHGGTIVGATDPLEPSAAAVKPPRGDSVGIPPAGVRLIEFR